MRAATLFLHRADQGVDVGLVRLCRLSKSDMSQTVNLKLSRFERQPWGFRLHGGTDFGTPLLIQKVDKADQIVFETFINNTLNKC